MLEYNMWNKKTTIEEDQQEIIIGKAKKFHDLERIQLATKDWKIPPYIVYLAGARGNGKTVTLGNLMMDAVKENRQVIWTRNFENTFYKPSFYKGFLNLLKRYCGVPEEFTAKPEGVYNDEKGGDLVCIFKSINMGTELKGNEYRDVKYLLCDEFMVLSTERYPSGAPEKLGVMLDSLRTFAEACVLASNFTYITNPYWASMNIFPMKNYGVTTFKDKATVIEVCEKGYYNQARFKPGDPRANAINSLQGGRDHSSYDDDPNFELIQRAPSRYMKPLDFELATPALTINFLIHPKGLTFAQPGKAKNKVDRYVTHPRLIDKNSEFIPDYLVKWLKELINTSSIRFSEANVLYETMRIIHKV